jgi:SAM-dependent methyltransferase
MLFSAVSSDNPAILDLGCGTGISTRQLSRKGIKVIGADKDAQMIEGARSQDPLGTYVIASADQLPFPDQTFDAVTAFSSFHWFAHERAVREIERVVLRGGVVLVVNKNEADDFKAGYRSILQRFVDEDLPDVKKEYNPSRLLTECGLVEIRTLEATVTELFTLSEAVSYLQSVSQWNLVPDICKDAATKSLHAYCVNRANQAGLVERKTIVFAVAFRRPSVQ